MVDGILEVAHRIFVPRMYCPVTGVRRSSGWPAARSRHLLKFPFCAWCGGVQSLQVHHIKPFHINPELELDEENFLTLCEHPGRWCHYCIGHRCDWKDFNPKVVEFCRLAA